VSKRIPKEQEQSYPSKLNSKVQIVAAGVLLMEVTRSRKLIMVRMQVVEDRCLECGRSKSNQDVINH
jgi:ribosomal protein L4